jgi:hypothetical protein
VFPIHGYFNEEIISRLGKWRVKFRRITIRCLSLAPAAVEGLSM